MLEGGHGDHTVTGWAVVNTLPHQEARAEANLLRQGFNPWLPSMLRTRRHARRFDVIRAPVFPGYLFVELDPAVDQWKRINGTFGVRRLLTQGERPQLLPAAFIDGLRSSVGEDGTCRLGRDELEAGSAVRVVAGPFADMLATVAGMASDDRVRLLLSVLGAGVGVTMSRSAVVPAA